jgi:hypothetical protein
MKLPSTSARCEHRPPDKYETLDDLFAQAKHYAEWSLREKGSVWPALFILSLDDRPAFFAWSHDFGDEQSKDAFRDLCRCFCMAHAATAAVLALETWVSCHNVKPGAKRELPKGAPMPSEDPDRREVITLLGETTGHQAQMQIVPIVRSDNRKFFGLGPADKMDGYMADGRFTPLLTPKLPDVHMRELAKLALAAQGIKVAGVVDTRL